VENYVHKNQSKGRTSLDQNVVQEEEPMDLSDCALEKLICSPSLLRTLSDAELMTALRKGCNDALAVLFERHNALVFRIARSIVRDDGEAEETVQRVFLDVFRAAKQFDSGRGTFTTWLLQYAYHRSIDRREHLLANRFYSSEELDEFAQAELMQTTGRLLCLGPQEVVRLAEEVLALLDSRQREVVELTYIEGLTAQEVANKTGDSATSVRHKLYQGLSRLRNIFHEKQKSRATIDAVEPEPKSQGGTCWIPTRIMKNCAP
jgi:RNA polymerase sigma-70 factor, ECF subfamily